MLTIVLIFEGEVVVVHLFPNIFQQIILDILLRHDRPLLANPAPLLSSGLLAVLDTPLVLRHACTPLRALIEHDQQNNNKISHRQGGASGFENGMGRKRTKVHWILLLNRQLCMELLAFGQYPFSTNVRLM